MIAKDCGFGSVNAIEHKNWTVLQSFVSGLEDFYIRQRILEMDVLFLDKALKTSEVLTRAKIDASKYDTFVCLQASLFAIGEQETKIKSEVFPKVP